MSVFLPRNKGGSTYVANRERFVMLFWLCYTISIGGVDKGTNYVFRRIVDCAF